MYAKNLANDVANDIAVRLFDMDNSKINRLHNANELIPYIYIMIRNERCNPKSICNMRYASPETIMSDIDDDYKPLDISDIISILNPYELKLLTIYSETKNIVELSKKYNIRRATLYKDIKEIQRKIKQSI